MKTISSASSVDPLDASHLATHSPNLLAKLALGLIRLYQWTLSPLLGNCCRFYPSCSKYAAQCYVRYGFFSATYKTFLRLAKCQPWHPGGVDLP